MTLQQPAVGLQQGGCSRTLKTGSSTASELGTPAAIWLVMMRCTSWMLLGAAVAVVLGQQAGLYLFSDPQAWIAAAIGAALGSISYGGKNETSFVKQDQRTQYVRAHRRMRFAMPRQRLPEPTSIG